MFATQSQPCNVASALYSNLLINISRKTVQRIDIDMKRTICKGCRSYLLAGVNARTRVKKKKVFCTCLVCGKSKTYDMKNENYMPWTHKPESVVEILDYTPLERCSQYADNKSSN